MTGQERIVLIVSSNSALRAALGETLESVGCLTKAYASASSRNFLSDVAAVDGGCVLLADPGPQVSQLAVLTSMVAVRPELAVIIVADGATTLAPQDAFKAGALDILEEPIAAEELVDSVERAFLVLDVREADGTDSEEVDYVRHKIEQLTAKERLIFDMLVIGQSDDFIKTSLRIGMLDLIKHRDSIMEKMEARSVMQLMRMALLLGIPINGKAFARPNRAPKRDPWKTPSTA